MILLIVGMMLTVAPAPTTCAVLSDAKADLSDKVLCDPINDATATFRADGTAETMRFTVRLTTAQARAILVTVEPVANETVSVATGAAPPQPLIAGEHPLVVADNVDFTFVVSAPSSAAKDSVQSRSVPIGIEILPPNDCSDGKAVLGSLNNAVVCSSIDSVKGTFDPSGEFYFLVVPGLPAGAVLFDVAELPSGVTIQLQATASRGPVVNLFGAPLQIGNAGRFLAYTHPHNNIAIKVSRTPPAGATDSSPEITLRMSVSPINYTTGEDSVAVSKVNRLLALRPPVEMLTIPNTTCYVSKPNYGISFGLDRFSDDEWTTQGGYFVVTPQRSPPSRSRLSFDGVDSGLHHEVLWDPFLDARLPQTVKLESGKWRVSLWSDRIPRSGDGLDTAWQQAADPLKGTTCNDIKFKALFLNQCGSKNTGKPGCSDAVAENSRFDEFSISIRPREFVNVDEAAAALRQSNGGRLGGADLRPAIQSLDRSTGEDVVNDLFDVAAEVAVERAQTRAGQLFERRVVHTVCDEWNGTVSLSGSPDETLELRQTCKVLRSLKLNDGAAASRALTRAVTADIVDGAFRLTVLTTTCQRAVRAYPANKDPKALSRGCNNNENEQRLTVLMMTIRPALDEVVEEIADGRGWSKDLPQRLVLALGAGLENGAMEAGATGDQVRRVKTMLAIAAICHAQGGCDARAIADFVSNAAKLTNGADLTRDSEAAVSFIRRTLLLMEDAREMSERDRVRSAVRLTFDAALLLLKSEDAGARGVVTDVAELLDAVIVQDLPRALTASAAIVGFAIAHSQSISLTHPDSHGDGSVSHDPALAAQRYRKAVALLGSLTSYVATYGARDISDENRREQRKKAIEAVVDASTDRRHRAGDAITSLGIHVGGLAAVSVTPYPTHSGWRSFGPRGTAALSLPLGMSWERLPGSTADVLPCLPPWLGLRGSVHAFDLGQYITVASDSGLNSPRFDTAIALGVEGGALFAAEGDHESPVFVGLDVRYAPTLFSTSDPFSLARNGGSLQVGVTAGLYIPFFDFN